MAETRQRVESQYLRNYVPLSELTQDNLQELARSTYVEQLPAGRTLFKKGDADNRSYYILGGEIELDGGDTPPKIIAGATPASRFPLDHHRPRQATAKARTPVFYFQVDNNHLDLLLTWGQNAGYMVAEIDSAEETADDGDWMTHMLRSSIFHRIPASNIQAVFMKMEPKPVRAGDVVIHQGDEGDYYYYIKQGRVAVTRLTKTGQTIKLAELEAGSSFGEEALISDSKRNANVTMLTNGVLMRLAKADFASLLKEPVLQSVSYDEAQKLVESGQGQWLDVRLESEYKNASLPGSINIPLFMLRLKASSLDQSKKYIVYCDTGRRSSSAVFLLTERGFDAYVLKDGLMAIKPGASA
jgi:CRP-like cAMP-binding protein